MEDMKQQLIYQAAEDMVKQKELLIKEALDHYFGAEKWNETAIAEQVMLVFHQDGTEALTIDGHVFIEFQQILTNVNVEAESGQVTCTYHQGYTRTYL